MITSDGKPQEDPDMRSRPLDFGALLSYSDGITSPSFMLQNAETLLPVYSCVIAEASSEPPLPIRRFRQLWKRGLLNLSLDDF